VSLQTLKALMYFLFSHANTLDGIRRKHPLSEFVDVKHHVEFCEGIEWLHLSFSKWNPIHYQE